MAKGGKNEILLSIALEGDEEIKRKLKAVGDEGKRSLADIERNAGRAGEGVGRRFAESAAEPLSKVKEAFAPFLEEAGLGAAGGLLARLFGVAGPTAAIAALSGIALRLAKVSEESERARGRLKGFGDAGGFDKLTEQAKSLGTDVGSLQPRYERFLALQQKLTAENSTIVHPPGFVPGAAEENAAGVRVFANGGQISPPSRGNFQAFDSALLRQIRRDVSSAEEAAQIAAEFEGGLGQSGRLTPEALRSLQQRAPNAANFVTSSLAPLLGRGFANPNELATLLERGGARVTSTDLINEGAKNSQAAAKDAESARGITEAFDGLRASAGRLEEKFAEIAGKPLNKAITETFDKAAGAVDKASELLDHNKDSIEKGAAIGREIGSKLPIPGAGFAGAIEGGVVGGAVGIGGDVLKDTVGSTKIGDFLGKALTNPAAIEDNVPEPAGPNRLTAEGLAATRIPSPFGASPAEPQPPSSGTESQGTGFIAALQEALRSFLQGVTNKANSLVPPQDTKVEGPVESLGVRGALDDSTQNVASALKDAGNELAAAISGIAANIKSSKGSGDAEAAPVQAAAGGGWIRRYIGGGGVSGPGTSTSDSIPAMLSDGEYVIRAEAARKIGRSGLDWLNAGRFSRGGRVARLAGGGGLSPDWFDPDLTDEESINLLNETVLSPQQLRLVALNNAKTPEESIKLLNRFIMGRHADGGPIGHFALGGTVNFGDSIGHLFSGGGAAADAPSLGDLGAAGGVRELHPVTIQMPGGNSVGPMLADSEIVNAVRREARDSANFQTGPSPGWAHGGR